MRAIRWWSVVSGVMLTACGGGIPCEQPPSKTDLEVYHAALLELQAPTECRRPGTRTLIMLGVPIRDRWTHSSYWFPRRCGQTTSDSYLCRNYTRTGVLDESLTAPVPYELIPETGLDAIDRVLAAADGRDAVGFSLVGHDENESEALVYVSHICGTSLGAGYYILFGSENHQWVLRDRVRVWRHAPEDALPRPVAAASGTTR